MVRPKYYAVRIGREGSKIYTSWDECKANTARWPAAIHKSFLSRTQAERWLSEGPTLPVPIVKQISRISKPPQKRQRQESSLPGGTTPGVIVLSAEQQQVLDLVRDGKSVFFTGSAGTGKSLLLREIIKLLKEKDEGEYSVAITASTGIASVNIGGCTVHSWAGINLGNETAKKIAGMLIGQTKYDKVKQRWRRVKTLVVDEISMIDGTLFDKLENVARIVRGSDRAFGGIQLVLSGDFAQLPPVPRKDKAGVEIPAVFAFQASTWEQCVGKPVLLKKVFRQHDQTFIDMLNAMRFADMSPRMIEIFQGLSRSVRYDDGIEPTELYPTRLEVDKANFTRLHQLATEAHNYLAMDLPGVDEKGQQVSMDHAKKLLERLIAPSELTVKIGAQVMLIKNLLQGELVNGSLGVVTAFSTTRDAQRQHAEIAVEGAATTDQPSALGSKPSISPPHKPEIDMKWPVVRFTNGRTMVMVPQQFTVINGEGETEAQREQVPLILAWALSMHKSQGQTLERVRVDLKRVFEKGQAYVALSRATKLETLQVLNFNPSKVKAHPDVVEWYKSLMGERYMTDGDRDEFDDHDEEMLYD